MPQQPFGSQDFNRTIATLPEGMDPFWGDSYASQKHRLDVGSQDQTSRALDALQRVAGAKRDILADDVAMRADQTARFGMDRAGVEANIADFEAERAAGREMLPQASALHQRGRGEAAEDIYGRYMAPAQTKAAADLAGAQIAGQSRVGAAQVGAEGRSYDNFIRGLMSAARKGTGSGMNEVDMPGLQQILDFFRQQGVAAPR